MPFHYPGMMWSLVEPRDGVEPSAARYKGAVVAGRRGVVPGQGLEPRFAGPEPAVLPLDDPGACRDDGAATCSMRFRRRDSNPDRRLQRPPAYPLADAGSRPESAPQESNPPDAAWKAAASVARPDAR